MIASAHIAAGLVAGMASARATKQRAVRIAAACTLGVVAHVLLDALPHSDYVSLSRLTTGVLVSLEFVVVIAIAAFILRPRLLPHWPEYLLPGLFGAVLPDAKFITSMLLSDRHASLVAYYGDRFHEGFHAGPTSPIVGVTVEVLCAMLLMGFLYTFPRLEHRREGYIEGLIDGIDVSRLPDT